MDVNSTKNLFSVERSGKLAFFTDYVNVKKGHSIVFFLRECNGLYFSGQCSSQFSSGLIKNALANVEPMENTMATLSICL